VWRGRICDFPGFQIAVPLAAVLIAVPFVLPLWRLMAWVLRRRCRWWWLNQQSDVPHAAAPAVDANNAIALQMIGPQAAGAPL
jgi:hypothetical protein